MLLYEVLGFRSQDRTGEALSVENRVAIYHPLEVIEQRLLQTRSRLA